MSSDGVDSGGLVGTKAILSGVVILVVTTLLVHVADKRKITWLSAGTVACLIGLVAGGILRAINFQFDFDQDLFFDTLLPPIIFHAGFSLKRRNFFKNITTIVLFAYLGTIISTIIIGLACWGIGVSSVISLTPFEALLFGALISATDPVATLATFEKLEAPALLYNLVFGEAVLNDAVAVVIFSSVLKVAEINEFSSLTAFKSLGLFVGVSVGSTFTGVLLALIGAVTLKHIHLRDTHLELPFLILIAYASYLVAEICSLSGIMSMFFCGVVSAHYTLYNMSEASQISSTAFFRALAYLSEEFVFAYLGLTVWVKGYAWNPSFIVLAMAACLFARAANTFPLSAIANIRRSNKIPFRFQILIWFAGVRGAIAVALAFSIPTSFPHRELIVTTTLAIALFTTVIMGGLTQGVMFIAQVKPKTTEIETSLVQEEDREYQSAPKKSFHAKWQHFDEKILKPLFGGRKRENTEPQPQLLVLRESAGL